MAGSVPEVDKLAVRVVTDSYHLALAPSMKTNDVEIPGLAIAWGVE